MTCKSAINSSGYWLDRGNARRFLDDLHQKLELRSFEDWYKVKTRSVTQNGGGGLLNAYGGSLRRAVQQLYPEYLWDGTRWSIRLSKGFWALESNRRKFIADLELKIGIVNLEDWYKVSKDELFAKGGRKLIDQYGSLFNALLQLRSNHDWRPYRFEHFQVPDGFWLKRTNQLDFVNFFKANRNIIRDEDWYQIKKSDIEQFGGHGLLNQYRGSLTALLKDLVPSLASSKNWTLTAQSSKSQKFLFESVQLLLPKEDVVANYDFGRMSEQQTQLCSLEVDVAVPSISLAFEYQGEQHYYDYLRFNTLQVQQRMDKTKRQGLTACGVTLLQIPFWWDRSAESLAATIVAKRPDLKPRLKFALPDDSAWISVGRVGPIPTSPLAAYMESPRQLAT
eukprot:TRINITY_DN5113_c0_g2_i1.p1 TRINITY_DN5113_c0_g2~~TRINITY_DN5113_c0_g2_i1.p1  ORF type:complete len:393 (-),score=65.41 TRINITY_DN5113_c0_g2_i1:145-1323(-)